VTEVFQRLSTLEPAAAGAAELTPDEQPFLRFDPAAQEVFDAWRGDLEQTLRAEAEHPVWRAPSRASQSSAGSGRRPSGPVTAAAHRAVPPQSAAPGGRRHDRSRRVPPEASESP
jgi:hypothetical protein